MGVRISDGLPRGGLGYIGLIPADTAQVNRPRCTDLRVVTQRTTRSDAMEGLGRKEVRCWRRAFFEVAQQLAVSASFQS